MNDAADQWDPTLKLHCPYCHGSAHLCDSSVVYNGRSFGMIYVCENYPQCDAYVGVHKGTTKPLGRLADSELRHWKKRAHEVFDPLWLQAYKCYTFDNLKTIRREKAKVTRIARTRCYAWLAAQLGIEVEACHIGAFDVAQCQQVIAVCAGQSYKRIRKWYKQTTTL